MWGKFFPDQTNDWYLICRECDSEFYVWESCECSQVDSGEFIEEERDHAA